MQVRTAIKKSRFAMESNMDSEREKKRQRKMEREIFWVGENNGKTLIINT